MVNVDSVTKAVIKGYTDLNYFSKITPYDFGEGLAKAVKYDSLMPIDFIIRKFKG